MYERLFAPPNSSYRTLPNGNFFDLLLNARKLGLVSLDIPVANASVIICELLILVMSIIVYLINQMTSLSKERSAVRQ